MDTRNVSDVPKFTRGEKCIFVHLILTFVLIMTLVIVYFVHLCVVRHPGTSYMSTRRDSHSHADTEEVTAADYLPIGILYLNSSNNQVICNTIHLRESWSLAPAHCVLALSDPGTAQLLPHWRIMYKTADLRYMVTRIKRSVAHPHFNSDDFSNNIGLLEHTTSIPIHQYITFNITKASYRNVDAESNLRIAEWDQTVLENKGAHVNPYNLYKVDTMDKAKCNSLMAPVVDIRSYEYCVSLQQQSAVNFLHGAALLELYEVRGIFTWGERKGKTLPFVILNIVHFKDWLLDVVILKSVNM